MLLLTHLCDISRNTPVGTNGRYQLTALSTGVPTLAIPMNAKTSIVNKFELGRGYNFFFNFGQDVKVGDIITWSGNTHVVSAVQIYDLPLVQHIEVSAEQEVV